MTARDPALRPRTLLPPPLVYALALGAAWWLEGRWPLGFERHAFTRAFGWGLIGLGLAGMFWALAAIWRRRTTVNPYKAASALVTTGPFAYSRNPIYVSDWLVYAGVTLLFASTWPLLLAPAVWWVMRYAVIAHEEAHLLARFGDDYRAYQARVRRWL